MKHLFKMLLLVSVIGLTSCNTVFRTKNQTINVFSNAADAKITVNDTTYQLPAKIQVLRSKEPLPMHFSSAKKNKDSVLIAKRGPVFYVLNGLTLGVGYFVDVRNEKRFKYNSNIFFNVKDTMALHEYHADRIIAYKHIVDEEKQEKIRKQVENDFTNAEKARQKRKDSEFKRYNPKAGTLRFNIQPPTLFLAGVSTENKNVTRFSNTLGGLGLGVGFDYYYKNNRFVGVESSVRTNVFDFMNGPADDIRVSKFDVSLRNGLRWERFEAGYGLSFIYTRFSYATPSSHDDRNWHRSEYRALGFSTLFNYQLTSVMFVGVRYNPSVYSFRKTGNSFDYEHVIGIDYRIKF